MRSSGSTASRSAGPTSWAVRRPRTCSSSTRCAAAPCCPGCRPIHRSRSAWPGCARWPGGRDRSEAMTHRLYHDDAYLRRFDAEVVAITTYKSRPAVVLDRTALYPEAGGQLGDRGRLGELAVVDTQETDDGTIVHIVESQVESKVESQIEGELPAVGGRITGELDWVRRRQHMAQHTAQHL